MDRGFSAKKINGMRTQNIELECIKYVGSAYRDSGIPFFQAIFDTRFALFFHDSSQWSWKGAISLAIKALTKREEFSIFIPVRPSSTSGLSILIIDQPSPPSYRKILRRLEQLMRDSARDANLDVDFSYPVCVQKKASILHHLQDSFFVISVVLTSLVSPRVEEKKYRSFRIKRILLGVKELLSYRLASRNFEDIGRYNSTIVINENWSCNPLFLRKSRVYDVVSMHYPHGLMSPIVLPVVADIQLFWNSRMRSRFEDGVRQSEIVGFVEGYSSGDNISESPRSGDAP
ncbi:MAG: hypothetical protein ACQKBU_02130, partial [Verrucomicrobiales bacterium]